MNRDEIVEKLLPYIQAWIRSDKTYTARFAIGMLMQRNSMKRYCHILKRRGWMTGCTIRQSRKA